MAESSFKVDDEAAKTLVEMVSYLERQGQVPENTAMSPCLGRQDLLSSDPICTLELADAAAHIKVGSYYEIDHSKLSAETPDQLKPIRVILVSKKCKDNVSLRFPSMYSLRAHFRELNQRKLKVKMLPTLDEMYVIGSELAGEVLYRRILPHEVAAQRNLWSFWVVPSMVPLQDKTSNTSAVMATKKGLCFLELKSSGLVQWGQQQQLRFLAPHKQDKREKIMTSNEENEESQHEDNDEDDVEDEEKDREGSDKESMDTDDHQSREPRKARKRKHNGSRYRAQELKRRNREKHSQITLYNPSERKVLKNSIERWSEERYKLAEENMLKIMKENDAVFGNPIIRLVLRAKARKLIGDTGLLDHLLKHMADKVAPGGEERFRRRHNVDGVMEYWLESSDLLNIRMKAGIQDPYWIPPPGWKLGDHPTQDPFCAKELRELREEIAKLKWEFQIMNDKKEEDLAIVTIPDPSIASENLEYKNLLLTLKESYIDLTNRKAKLEEQLVEISESFCGLKEEMRKLQSAVEEQNKPGSDATPFLLPASTILASGSERETPGEEGKEYSKAAAATEDRAEKIERLKSAFSICKPQSSLLWPNTSLSPQAVVPDDGLHVVHTPPSVCSSTTSALRCPISPVKPLAERGPVTVALSPGSAIRCPPPPPPTPLEASTSTDQTSLINLNEVPNHANDTGFYRQSSASHSRLTSTAMPHLVGHQFQRDQEHGWL